jgi:hypothetical protein
MESSVNGRGEGGKRLLFRACCAYSATRHAQERGNARRPVFATDADRLVYLDLLASNCRLPTKNRAR